MDTILLVDDSTENLSGTHKALQKAGYNVAYVTDYQQAFAHIRMFNEEMSTLVVSLNNSLGYPFLRKLNSEVHANSKIIIYSSNPASSIKQWVERAGFKRFLQHPKDEGSLFNRIKANFYQKGIFFTNEELDKLTATFSKYNTSAERLVKHKALHSKSIQELQHKLARCLTDFEHQKKFLAEVQ